MLDAFVDFLLVVPPTDGQDALTSAMNWKFNPHLGFLLFGARARSGIGFRQVCVSATC